MTEATAFPPICSGHKCPMPWEVKQALSFFNRPSPSWLAACNWKSPGIKFQLFYYLYVLDWESHFPSLSLSLLICKRERPYSTLRAFELGSPSTWSWACCSQANQLALLLPFQLVITNQSGTAVKLHQPLSLTGIASSGPRRHPKKEWRPRDKDVKLAGQQLFATLLLTVVCAPRMKWMLILRGKRTELFWP